MELWVTLSAIILLVAGSAGAIAGGWLFGRAAGHRNWLPVLIGSVTITILAIVLIWHGFDMLGAVLNS